MKAKFIQKYQVAKVTCVTCGNEFEVGSVSQKKLELILVQIAPTHFIQDKKHSYKLQAV